MKTFEKQIRIIQEECNQAIRKAQSEEALEQVRITFLGRNGKIAPLMVKLKTFSTEEKRILGPLLNELKTTTHAAYEKRKAELAQEITKQDDRRQQYFDVTAYRYQPLHGSLHVYTHLIEQLSTIFTSMGYEIVDGPELETEYYNFTALNIPADHPARDLHDTFWFHEPGMLLRTHTSTVQAHVMETRQPPIAVFAPGRCYRNEATDASHDFMFIQAEGLLIDKNVSVSHLLATARAFLQTIFEKEDLEIRVRPGYFPFVEPGLEIDASCPFCTSGCSVCKKTGWIELLGGGLVHPNVLHYSGIDPEKYSGFAFGFGLERIAMIKHGINDIRLFRSNKIQFLDQF